MNAADTCRDLVRGGDKDRFLSSLFAPDDKRPHLLALYAFNVEVARIAGVVSEAQIGLIRQQWWLDTIDAIYGGHVPAHPVAEGLAGAIAAGHLPKHALHDLVIAREFDLHGDPVQSLEQLETYLGQTSSALIQMAALILAGPEAGKAAAAAGFAGVAYGLARLLHRPGFMTPGLDAAAHAQRRLEEARALRPVIPQAALPAFLPVSLTGLYLARPQPSQFRRQLRLWWAARQNTF